MKNKNFDFDVVKELNITIENEFDIYKQEEELRKNYAKKWNKGKFDFGLAQKGVKNLIVVPRIRKYQKEYGMKIGDPERSAIAKARLRAIMQRIREEDY